MKTDIKKYIISFFILSGLTAQAQFREESSALEQVYENKARLALDTLLLPDEYSLLVAVDIDQDEKRLTDLENEIEKNNLPGMPGAVDMGNFSISNKLHNLKQKVSVHIVLGNTVSKDKEDTIRTLVTMKLHMDESSGDVIKISRSILPHQIEEAPTRKMPELSWKMWTLVLILALLMLAGLAFIYNRKKSTLEENEKEKENKNKEPMDNPIQIPQDNELHAASELSKVKQTDYSTSEDYLLLEMKQKILTMAQQFPEASTRSLSEYYNQGMEQNILLFMESIGWDLSKKIFHALSPRIWGRIGFLFKSREVTPQPKDYFSAVDGVFKHLMARFLELGTEDEKNPFSFIFSLTPPERKRVLANESVGHISVLCLYADNDQLGDLYELMDVKTQEAVTMHLTKMKSIPQELIQSTVSELQKKLKAVQATPVLNTDGIHFVTQLLSKLDAEKELTIFEKILMENPEDALRIRESRLMYMDIPLVPEDMIADAIGMLELSVIEEALFLGYPDVRHYILKSIPSKKAGMIERDMGYPDFKVTPSRSAHSKRVLVEALEKVMKSKNMEIKNFFEKTLISESLAS